MHIFYRQVREFCLLMQEALDRRARRLPEGETEPSAALAFTEKLLVCPTLEAARGCIDKDFSGALGFAQAVSAVLQQMQNGRVRPPAISPSQQTQFYVLSCAVHDYFRALSA
jgi:hypothetical protein